MLLKYFNNTEKYNLNRYIFFLLLLTSPLQYSKAASILNPIADYRFDACSLASQVEDSQMRFPGIASGTDSTDETSVLGSRSLDLSADSTSDWVTLPKSLIDGLDDFSFSVWVKTDEDKELQEIFHALGSSIEDDELEIYLKDDDKVTVKLFDSHIELESDDVELTDNSWHHLVITRKGKKVCLYVDGKKSECEEKAKTGSLSIPNNHSVIIGQEQDKLRTSADLNSGFSTSQNFEGFIDEVKIYSDTLNPAQITTLYNNESSGKNYDGSIRTLPSCGGIAPASLLAEYHFDACSLIDIANKIEDSKASFDGLATGADITNVSSVLGGRSLDLSKKDTSDWVTLPKSVIDGLNDFSFSVWIKTKNSSGHLDIIHALGSSTSDDEFEIYIREKDEVKIIIKDESVYLDADKKLTDNAWHHLVITRKDENICLYVDGSKTECDDDGESGPLSVVYDHSVVIGQEQDEFRTSADLNAGFESTQSFKGLIDEIGIYQSTLNSTQVRTLYNEQLTGDNTADCSNGGGGDTAASNFNCIEQGADAISGRLYTKTTNQSFALDIVALRDASTLENNFASGADHTVNIELVDASSGSCLTYTKLNPNISKEIVFTSTDLGRKSIALNKVTSAYKKIKCRISDKTDLNAVITGCSTDSFAIRPTTFNVSSSTLSSSSTPNSTFTPSNKAGTLFDLIFTGYSEQPNQIDNSKVTSLPNTSLSAELAGIRSSLAADSIFTGQFSYSEVGWFLLQEDAIYDDKFTEFSGDEQAADCIKNSFENDPSNDPLGKKRVGCNFGNTATSDYFGRFTPDHFKVTASTAGVFADTCSGFTYSGQALSYQTAPTLTVTAYNGLSPASITENYTGSYADGLNASDFNVTAPSTDSSQLGSDGTNLINLSWTPDTATLADNNNGSLTFSFGSDSFTYLHEDNSKIAAFIPTIDFIFTDITDNDGIQTQALAQTVQASGSSIRFGRLNMDNVHGSELTALSVPLYTEYFNGAQFIPNTADTCSSVAINQFSYNAGTSPVTVGSASSTASVNNPTLVLGQAALSFTAPGAGNTGYIDITSDTFLLAAPWLAFDWDNNGNHDNPPSARATFGIYKGHSKQIYLREIY